MLENNLLCRSLSHVLLAATLSQFACFAFACKRDPGIKIPEKLVQTGADVTVEPSGATIEKNEGAGGSSSAPADPAQPNPPNDTAGAPTPIVPPPTGGTQTPTPNPTLPAPNPLIIAPGAYFVRNAASLRCFNIPGGDLEQEVEFQIADCSVKDSQVFFFDNVKNNLYKITNKNSSYSMSIRGQDPVLNAVIEQFPYVGDPDQQYEISKVNDNYILKPKDSALAVSTKDKGTASGTTVVLATANSTLVQQWILIPLP